MHQREFERVWGDEMSIKNRIEKLEGTLACKDTPLRIILLEPGESQEEAVAAFYKKYPNPQKSLLIIIEKQWP
jgi:hypothetical protein